MTVETVTAGHGLLESPRWHAGRLWVADWTAGRILAVDPAGAVEVMVEHASLPLSFDFLPMGGPVLASGPARALLHPVDGPDGMELALVADLSGLSPHGCNEVVVDPTRVGLRDIPNIYVNNVNFDFAAGPPEGDPAPGFIALVTPGGGARVVADDLAFPNGMAISADGGTLIVAESYRHRLTAFDIAADGSLANRRVWADLSAGAKPHSPDGICLDADGAAWYADVADCCCVRVAQGGAVLQRVQLDRGAFACMLGGPDRSTLFMAAAHWPGPARLADYTGWDGTVVAVPAPAPGAGWPGG